MTTTETLPKYGPHNRYTLTEEHRAQLKPHADKWTAIALRGTPQTKEDRAMCMKQVPALYQAANLIPPRNIVFAPGPVSGAIASAIAAHAFVLRERGITEDIVQAVIRQSAERAARGDDREIKLEAILTVALQAADIGKPTEPTKDDVSKLVNETIDNLGTWSQMRNGGNQWAGWCCYLSFFDDIAQLGLPVYEKFRPYRDLAIHAGPRYMHTDFCVLSDFPTCEPGRDDRNRSHRSDGPALSWRDGYRHYSIHGVRVDRRVVEQPETLTVEEILTQRNVEVRRVMMDRFGIARLLKEADARVLDTGKDTLGNQTRLLSLSLEDDEALVMTEVINSTPEPDGTVKTYYERVPPTVTTVAEAMCWAFDVPEYKPLAET